MSRWPIFAFVCLFQAKNSWSIPYTTLIHWYIDTLIQVIWTILVSHIDNCSDLILKHQSYTVIIWLELCYYKSGSMKKKKERKACLRLIFFFGIAPHYFLCQRNFVIWFQLELTKYKIHIKLKSSLNWIFALRLKYWYVCIHTSCPCHNKIWKIRDWWSDALIEAVFHSDSGPLYFKQNWQYFPAKIFAKLSNIGIPVSMGGLKVWIITDCPPLQSFYSNLAKLPMSKMCKRSMKTAPLVFHAPSMKTLKGKRKE